jgi:hypothetical protein
MRLWKHLKNNTLELVIAFITVIGWVKVASLDLEFKDKISSGVLWLTAWLVVYYAVETKRLRIETEKLSQYSANQLKLQKEVMANELMPVAVPKSGFMQGTYLSLELENSGRGLMKNLNMKISDAPIPFGFIAAGDNIAQTREEPLLEGVAKQKPKSRIEVKFEYRDLYDGTYETLGCYFILDAQDSGARYNLMVNDWTFVTHRNNA